MGQCFVPPTDGDCFVIAEIGSSPAPGWDFERWLGVAAYTGAPAVKVQMFRGTHFPLSEQREKTALEFPRHRWGDFVYRAHEAGLKAGASVFDLQAIDLVLEYGDFIKVAAREQTNASLLATIATRREQIKYARPGDFRRPPVYRSVSDPRVVKRGYPFDLGTTCAGDVILLTIPRYPASLACALIQVCYAASVFGTRAWGWSSHTRNILDCWLAAKLGAAVIEKHLALESTDREAGHSLTAYDFRQMVERC